MNILLRTEFPFTISASICLEGYFQKTPACKLRNSFCKADLFTQIKRGSTNLAGPYSGSHSQQPAVTADLTEGDVTVKFTSDPSNSGYGFRMRWKAGWL